jgi:hypothetical protein
MKKCVNYLFLFVIIVLTSCKDDDVNIFDKTADERAAEAIAALKADLIAPANGWKVRYRPVEGSGSFFVYMKFGDDNKVTIDTDLGANNGEFHQKTIGYRIDSSLGLELIMENYSFFTYLFELDQATFGAEYEFNYVNKTPQGELVFSSKSDVSDPTILVFQQAGANEKATLAKPLSINLDSFSDPQNLFTAGSSRIVYNNKDLAIYLSLDVVKRVASFNYISPKTTLVGGMPLNLTTGYYLKGDSIVFESRLNVVYKGNSVSLRRLYLNALSETTMSFCPSTSVNTPLYSGSTSTGDPIVLEQTQFNNEGGELLSASEILLAAVQNVFNENGESAGDQIIADLEGAALMVWYNGAQTQTGTLNAIGFFIENADGTSTIAVHEYTANITGNIIELTFDPTVNFIRNPATDAEVSNMMTYLELMTREGKAYIYKINDQFYEIYNPCSGWSFVFEPLL